MELAKAPATPPMAPPTITPTGPPTLPIVAPISVPAETAATSTPIPVTARPVFSKNVLSEFAGSVYSVRFEPIVTALLTKGILFSTAVSPFTLAVDSIISAVPAFVLRAVLLRNSFPSIKVC